MPDAAVQSDLIITVTSRGCVCTGTGTIGQTPAGAGVISYHEYRTISYVSLQENGVDITIPVPGVRLPEADDARPVSITLLLLRADGGYVH